METKKDILTELDSLDDKGFRMIINQFIGMNSDDVRMWVMLEKSLNSPIIIKEVKI